MMTSVSIMVLETRRPAEKDDRVRLTIKADGSRSHVNIEIVMACALSEIELLLLAVRGVGQSAPRQQMSLYA